MKSGLYSEELQPVAFCHAAKVYSLQQRSGGLAWMPLVQMLRNKGRCAGRRSRNDQIFCLYFTEGSAPAPLCEARLLKTLCTGICCPHSRRMTQSSVKISTPVHNCYAVQALQNFLILQDTACLTVALSCDSSVCRKCSKAAATESICGKHH